MIKFVNKFVKKVFRNNNCSSFRNLELQLRSIVWKVSVCFFETVCLSAGFIYVEGKTQFLKQNTD